MWGYEKAQSLGKVLADRLFDGHGLQREAARSRQPHP